MEEVKLNLACGKDYRKGYINIDNKSMLRGKVDLQRDIFSLGWKKNTVDEILLSHFMMYIHLSEAPILLKRWYKWLKPNGKLIIETGDLEKICYTILSTDEPKVINGTNGVMQMFGFGKTIGHVWCWGAKTLIPLLEEAGFRVIKTEDGGLHNRPERDITITAWK